MKAIINSDGSVSFEVTGDKEFLVFKEIARVQEVFGHNQCGMCNSKDVKYVCRKTGAKKNVEWLEIVCQKCRAKLVFSKTEEGVVYPKITWNSLSEKQQEQRADEEKECRNGYLPNGGWFKWKGNYTDED